MRTFHIWTLGCQMNKADSLKLAAGLERLGCRAVDDDRDADLVVINTCSVRQHAEDRAYGRLGLLRKRRDTGVDFKIAVMGCMVGPRTDELERRFPQVDVWARPQQFDPILELAGVDRDASEGEFWIETLRRPGRSHGVRAGRSWLRQVLHVLHRPAAARPGALAPGCRSAGRSTPPGGARRARGDPCSARRSRPTATTSRRAPTSPRCSRASTASTASCARAFSLPIRKT